MKAQWIDRVGRQRERERERESWVVGGRGDSNGDWGRTETRKEIQRKSNGGRGREKS